MTREEALELNKKYQLSGEVKEIIKSKGLNYSIFIYYPRYAFFCSTCYAIELGGYFSYIDFSELRRSGSAFDRHARAILRRHGYLNQ